MAYILFMQSALLKSFIFHGILLVIIILSSFSYFSRKEVEPTITSITVDLKIAEKTNIPKAKNTSTKKVKPKKKPKPKKPKPKPKKPKEKPKPKPTPKVEVKEKPKPKPKKPEPKKEPKKEPEIDELSSLLKSLDAEDPQQQEITQQTEEYDPNQGLSVSEISAIMGGITDQIGECWNLPAGARNAADLFVSVDVDITRDGVMKFIGFSDKSKYYSDSFYQAAADSVRDAILNPRCNPLRRMPPADKYDVWREVVLTFSPEDQIY